MLDLAQLKVRGGGNDWMSTHGSKSQSKGPIRVLCNDNESRVRLDALKVVHKCLEDERVQEVSIWDETGLRDIQTNVIQP